MKIIKTVSDLEKIEKGCILTIGNFDGVHIGHQKVLTAAREIATRNNTKLIMMTFDPHPLAVLQPQKTPGILTPLPLRKHLLAELGVDYRLVLKTNLEMLKLSPANFVDKYLVKAIQPRVVVEGESFNFGFNRRGNVHTLYNLGSEKGFEVVIVEAREAKLSIGRTVKISSTLIRNMLAEGKVADSAAALGRPYRLIGQVIPGRGRGKVLGFPTANMQPPNQVIPAEAVYAGFVEIGDDFEQACTAKQRIPAALSIGTSSTYGSDIPLLIEAHILTDNVKNLLGKWLAVDFVKRIRSQEKFETEKELADQIAKDCERAKEILENI
ncbi:MAG: bifunctional riboflavin kinase/FAD synthetase [Planctomycetota bacterium]|jgi:riboflavin kinase/FMN adenylyltransferase